MAIPSSITAAEAPQPSFVGRFRALLFRKVSVPMPAIIVGAFCFNNLIQDYLGTKIDFFHGSFITDKNPDDIAEFYQAEDLLKIIAIHPFMFSLFMDKVKVGESPESEEEAHLSMEESRMVVQNLGMEASFVISEEEEEIDGENVKTSFKRYERFLDYVPILHDEGNKVLLWDQTWTFGFNRTEDGRTEVYHTGHRYYGPWPVRVIIHLHQKYVLWACQQYLSLEAFGSDEDDAMEKREAWLQPSLVQAIGRVANWVGTELNDAEDVVETVPSKGFWGSIRALRWMLPERSKAEVALSRALSMHRRSSEPEEPETGAQDEEAEEPDPIKPWNREENHYLKWRRASVLAACGEGLKK